ncbi:MAG: LPS export ABC transporter permease LptG [Nitrospirota bacterium]
MRIISKYVLMEFIRFFIITLIAFVILYMLGDFIEKIDDFIEHNTATGDVVRYLLYQLPNIAFMVMPLAVLLSTVLSLGLLSKNSEIIAMKAGGIPLYRIAAPIFTASIVLSGLLFWANETVIPYCNAKAEYIKTVKIEKKPERPSLKQDKLWFRGPKGEIINIGLVDFNSGTPTCYGLNFYMLDKQFRLVERVDAERMDWDNGTWVLSKGITYDFGQVGGIKITPFKTQVVKLPEKPEDFKRAERLSEEMDYSELESYIDKLRREGYNPVKYVVDLQGKISFTLANIIMVIVAVPFSLKTSRGGGMALGMGICIAVAISYWLMHSFSMSLGHAGRFPPFFAAWLANTLFFAGGIYLLLHTDR